MHETVYQLTPSKDKLIENVLSRDHLQLNHMILNKGEALPEHHSNSNVHMLVLKGKLNLTLGEEESREYTFGDFIEIPYNLKMNVRNLSDDLLEFVVIKAPHPDKYNG